MNEELENVKMIEIPGFIWANKDLDTADKMALITLWREREKSRKVIITPEKFSRLTSLPFESIFNILQNLDQHNFIELIEFDPDRKIEVDLILPEESVATVQKKIKADSENFDSSEDRLIAVWNNTFPGRPLTPSDFTHLTAYLERGIELELIEELINYTAKSAEGNPLAYLQSILNNLCEEHITTLAEYQQQKGEQSEYGRQISGDNKEKEKRDKLQDFEELDQREDWN